MKQLFTALLITLFINGGYVNAGVPSYSEYDNYKYEREILNIDKKLVEIEVNTIDYLKLEIEKLEIQRKVIDNNISNITNEYKINNCENIRYCNLDGTTKALVDLYKEKIEIKDIEILEKQELLNEKIEQEKQLEAEEKLQKQLENRRNKGKEYLEKAQKEEEKRDYKKALNSYKSSCQSYETYECYYGMGSTSFNLGKQYYEKKHLYGYESLSKKTLDEAIVKLQKALDLTENQKEKEETQKFIDLINAYANKENVEDSVSNISATDSIKKEENFSLVKKEVSLDDVRMQKINSKVELIFKRLDAITAKYSPERKEKLYTKLITQLENFKLKTQNKDLQEIIGILIMKLK